MSAKVIMIDPGKQFGQAIVYAWSSPYDDHKGYLKIGQVKSFELSKGVDVKDNSEDLKSIARKRILEQNKIGGYKYTIEYVALFRFEILSNDGSIPDIDDMVRRVLTNSGFKKAYFEQEHGDEWIECSTNAVKAAVNAVHQNRTALNPEELATLRERDAVPFTFYPHQKDCLEWSQKSFKSKDALLWEIKPRGGKTITAIELIRRMGLKKTLVYTARPDVNAEWKDAFDKIFASGKGGAEWVYGSRSGVGVSTFEELIREADAGKNVLWFSSTQFLRRTDDTSTAKERQQILDTKWDFIIIDEAHEATLTDLGKAVEEKAKKEKTRILKLSGTPYNLLDQFDKNEVFTFDYNEEQRRKESWDEKKEGYANPYARMPQIHLRTVKLTDFIKSLKTDDNAFSFREFFRVNKTNQFVHEKEVTDFLDLLKDEHKESFFPFCSDQNRGFFRHTLWVVPGVDAGAVLSKMLQNHPYFRGYKIINVCGPGDEEVPTEKATKLVRDGIASFWKESKFGTITLSCGKLTAGVTIPEWTGVLMLKGGGDTDAKLYLQTAFRVQGPYDSPEGLRKTSCYVFDFAPDRALTVLCSVCQANRNSNKQDSKEKAKELLKFFPVLSYDGNEFIEHDVDSLFRWYNKAAAERVKNSGFDSVFLYNWDKIRIAAGNDATIDEINSAWGGKKSGANGKHTVNDQGASEGGTTSVIRWTCPNCGKKDIVDDVCPNCGTRRPKTRWICECGHVNYDSKYCGACGKPRPEHKKDEAKSREKKLIATLRNISIRIPLLAFGADVTSDDEFRLDNFTSLVDDKSWTEFMPDGFPKVTNGDNLGFDYFKQFIDEDVFVIACTDIRNELKEADNFLPEERVKALIEIIHKFKNPAKETIITPWPVVNLHLGETIGGEVFFDIEGQDFRRALPEPKLIDHAGESVLQDIHSDVFYDENAKVLEINSKSGVYPLYLAYSMYKIHSSMDGGKNFEVDVWKRILEKNIYVLCQTEMAVKITNRVLRGFHSDWKTNCVYKDNLVEMFKERYDSDEETVNVINTPAFWGITEDNMINFTLAASNPPYQGAANNLQIYPLFYNCAIELAATVTMIFPTNWQTASKKCAMGLSRMNNERVKYDHQIVFIDNREEVFEGIAGAKFTNIILWKKGYDNGLKGKQLIYSNGKNPEEVQLQINVEEIVKPGEIIELHNCVKKNLGTNYACFDVSKYDPYRMPTTVFSRDSNNKFRDTPTSANDIKIYGTVNRKRTERYHIDDFHQECILNKDKQIDHVNMISKSSGFTFRKDISYDKYKVILPNVWGDMNEKAGLGGAFANIQIAEPKQIFTCAYNRCGVSDTKEQTVYSAKYIMTRFFRALLMINKHSKQTYSDAFLAVPAQDFHESWWNESIAAIDEHLFEKYNVPEHIRDFVRKNIQTKTEDNIINL